MNKIHRIELTALGADKHKATWTVEGRGLVADMIYIGQRTPMEVLRSFVQLLDDHGCEPTGPVEVSDTGHRLNGTIVKTEHNYIIQINASDVSISDISSAKETVN